MEKENVTAVDWLGNEIVGRIAKRGSHDIITIQTQGEILLDIITQAKALEAEQRLKDFNAGAVEERKRSKSDEMLEMLKECKEALSRIGHGIIEAKIKQLIKEATEL
jgi:hypothetical protein